MNYEFQITITKQIAQEIGLNIPTLNQDNEQYDFWTECISFTINNEIDDIDKKGTYYFLDMPSEVDILIDHDHKNEDKIYNYLKNEFPEQ